jgi:hypothetical protein
MRTEVLICSVPFSAEFHRILEAEVNKRVNGREIISASQPVTVGIGSGVCMTVVVKNS